MKEGLRVMILDDDVDLCHLLKQVLRKQTNQIFSAHSIHEGVECIKLVKPHVLFLDNNLPDGNGVDHLEAIKRIMPGIRIIMISGDTKEGLKEKAESLGVDRFYCKPFGYDVIQKALASLNLAWILPVWYMLSDSIQTM